MPGSDKISEYMETIFFRVLTVPQIFTASLPKKEGRPGIINRNIKKVPTNRKRVTTYSTVLICGFFCVITFEKSLPSKAVLECFYETRLA